jgi:RNA polymerase sigma-70 factor (ECF subfamily)
MPDVDAAITLVGRAQLGDAAAMDQVLRALQRPLFEHVRLIVRDMATAEDVLQDTLFIVCRQLPKLRDPRWLRAWAYRIATREAVRRARRERRWADAQRDEMVDDLPQPERAEAADAELLDALPALLDRLSPASRIVLHMHYVDGLTYPEIAEALEIAVGTVKSRLAYGLAALRRCVGAPTGR